MARVQHNKQRIDLETVRRLALAMADVDESTAYGAVAFKVRGKLLACVATNKSAEPGSLMVRVDQERRAELMEGAPHIYYVTDHYLAYPAVLVRLAEIDSDQMKDLLGMAWAFVGKIKARKSLG